MIEVSLPDEKEVFDKLVEKDFFKTSKDYFWTEYVFQIGECKDIGPYHQKLIKYDPEEEKLLESLFQNGVNDNYALKTVWNIYENSALFENNKVTEVGKNVIRQYLNYIYVVGLENILDIDLKRLESLENFFDELGLNPYKKERQYQKRIQKK